MRALDTNVLVRYLAADDPQQTPVAVRLIENCLKNQEPLFLSVLVLCETVWVLDRAYKQAKADLLSTVEQVVDADLFVIEQRDAVRRSIEDWRKGKGDFSDYAIGNIARVAKCTDTATFDRKLKGSSGFTVLR